MENGEVSRPCGVRSQPVMRLLRKATGGQWLSQWLKPRKMWILCLKKFYSKVFGLHLWLEDLFEEAVF